MGQAIAGDAKYGNEAFNREMGALGLKRLFLHAWRLTIPRAEGADLRLECPLDPELQRFLGTLRNSNRHEFVNHPNDEDS